MKIHIFVITIIATVILTLGCVNQENQTANLTNQTNQTSTIPTKAYSINEISFNYPDTWNLTRANAGNRTFIAVTDPEFTKTNGTNGSAFMIFKTTKTGVNKANLRKEMLQNMQHLGENITATTMTNINGITANETTYRVTNENGTIGQINFIDFEKNNNIYILMISTVGTDLQSHKTNFDVILNSFKIQ